MVLGGSFLRLTAGGVALADGMIHAAELDEHYAAALYMGILFSFAIVFLSMLGVALVLSPFDSPHDPLGRLTRAAGILLMAGLIVGYIVSRDPGLPGFHEGWENVGITTLAMELLVIGLLVADLSGTRRPLGRV